MSNLPALSAPREKVLALKNVLQNPKVQSGIKAVVPRFITPERMLKICANAIEKNPLLAECSQTSFLGAVMTSAALGLEPNTLAGHAYLIPYKARRKIGGQWVDVYDCQFQLGYKGCIELAHRNESCVSFSGLPVFSNDKFRYFISGDMGDLSLEYEAARRDRGDLEGAFSIAVFQRANGARGRAAVWMTEEDISKVRAKSQTYTSLTRALEKAEAEGDSRAIERARRNLEDTPWVAWAPEMFAKSAIRRLAKQLPIFGNLLAASEIEERSDAGRLDMEALSDPGLVKAVVSGEEEAPTVEQEDEPPRPALSVHTGGQAPVSPYEGKPGRHPNDCTCSRCRQKRSDAQTQAQPQQRQDTQQPQPTAHDDRGHGDPPYDPETGEITGEQEGDGFQFEG